MTFTLFHRSDGRKRAAVDQPHPFSPRNPPAADREEILVIQRSIIISLAFVQHMLALYAGGIEMHYIIHLHFPVRFFWN